MTDDTIYRQAAIDALEKVAMLFPYRIPGNRDTYDQYNEAWNDAIGRAEIALEELPSAQPEIIRCKDCKFWTHIKRTNRYWCKTDDGLYDLNPSPDDFCSRAERRTDE